MQHTHFHEYQLLAIADIHGVSGLDHMEVPSALSELSFNTFHGIGSAVDRNIWDLLHQSSQRTGMVAFAVVGHNEVDLLQVNFLFQILNEIKTVRSPDRIGAESRPYQ